MDLPRYVHLASCQHTVYICSSQALAGTCTTSTQYLSPGDVSPLSQRVVHFEYRLRGLDK